MDMNPNAIIINCLNSEDSMMHNYIDWCEENDEIICKTPIRVMHFRKFPEFWNDDDDDDLSRLFESFKATVEEYAAQKTFFVVVDCIFFDDEDIPIQFLKDNFIYHEFKTELPDDDIHGIGEEFKQLCLKLES